MDEIQSFIVELLEARGPISGEGNFENFNYMESGHIDSIALVKFVLDLECHFDIEIKPEDILSEKFRTVGGLASLVREKIKS